jgi:hypothetical protein
MPKFVLEWLPLKFNALHLSAGRAAAAPFDEFINFGAGSFRYDFDRAVVTVFDPAGKREILRLRDGGGAKKNPLNPADDFHVSAYWIFRSFHGGCFRYRERMPLQIAMSVPDAGPLDTSLLTVRTAQPQLF